MTSRGGRLFVERVNVKCDTGRRITTKFLLPLRTYRMIFKRDGEMGVEPHKSEEKM